MVEKSEETKTDQISKLISELHHPDSLERQKARYALIAIGQEAGPGLVEVVANERGHARWEAIEALGRIRYRDAAEALVEAILDDDTGVRWAASNALIELDRAALKPLLLTLTQYSDSPWFRTGAHHVLHVLKDWGHLLPKEIKVFEALEGVEPMVAVPWVAEDALRDLEKKQD